MFSGNVSQQGLGLFVVDRDPVPLDAVCTVHVCISLSLQATKMNTSNSSMERSITHSCNDHAEYSDAMIAQDKRRRSLSESDAGRMRCGRSGLAGRSNVPRISGGDVEKDIQR